MNIVEPENRIRVLAALVKDVEEHDYAVTAGDIGFRYLLQALAQGGRSDVIYRMINQEDKPGYGYQLKHGATSLTEAWDARRSASQDHFMLGQITEWFYKDLAGIDIDPTGTGFKKIILRPNPVGDLSWVEATYDALPGKISVRWSRKDEDFQLKATVPANTTATIFVPAREGTAVSEGGGPAEKQSGVTFLRRDGDREIYGLEAGSYVFESRW
jgi:alpha-L-rhamnosidase